MNNMLKKKISILKWIPAIIIICCSWYLSSQPTIQHMPKFPHADKIVHFICFGGLCFWITFALRRKRYIAIAVTSLYGIIDEIHQSFVPGRSCSIFDWIADTTGAIAGFFIFLLVLFIYSKKLRHY